MSVTTAYQNPVSASDAGGSPFSAWESMSAATGPSDGIFSQCLIPGDPGIDPDGYLGFLGFVFGAIAEIAKDTSVSNATLEILVRGAGGLTTLPHCWVIETVGSGIIFDSVSALAITGTAAWISIPLANLRVQGITPTWGAGASLQLQFPDNDLLHAGRAVQIDAIRLTLTYWPTGGGNTCAMNHRRKEMRRNGRSRMRG